MQAAPTTAGDGIVESKLQIVVAKEPVERRPGFAVPAAVTSHAVRLQTGRNRTGGFNGLLIKSSFFATLTVKPLRTDRHKMAVDRATLRFREPNQRLKSPPTLP